ncbi:MAG: S8 family serine peptidase [Candidatus Doudnabacteria bacterium]|nr:S8 family serine peptidase [Candidatus Doudnabacteria bacterium]
MKFFSTQHQHSFLSNLLESAAKILSFAAVFAFIASPIFPVNYALAQKSETTYMVKLKTGFGENLLSKVGSNIRHRFVSAESPVFYNIYSFSSGYSAAVLTDYLKNKAEYLEEQKPLAASSVYVNDPGFSTDPLNIDKQWALIKAGFDKAWEKTTGSKSNVVAVIDTGVDETHQDLSAINFVKGFNFISNQEIATSTNSDDNGHGTLVTGVLGATANNGLGIIGTNWQISVMPLKALDANGKGEAADVAEAIVWATDHGAQFLNMSIGGIGFGHDTTLANAVTYAFNKNVLLVAAAGNDVAATGSNLDQSPVFPICDDNNFNMVIGVSASDQNDLKPDFSNYGRNCIDVTAPGKRILSTINYDPLTKKASPSSYAYASGTSLAVPFVVGQAALIKALYPFATNIQIRDRIITTADPIDNLNLTQCAGGPCRGLLGTGRINVLNSLQTAIAQGYAEGDLVKEESTGAMYQIIGGQKRLISPFVYNQRFSGSKLKTLSAGELASLPDGSYVTPNDGTLVKLDSDPTVYVIANGQKQPVSYQVFLQRKMNFASVNTLSFSEVNSWITGSFYPPEEGTLIKSDKDKTVYWVVGQTLHPINYGFFMERGLNVFPILVVSEKDIVSFAKGESYIR